MAGIFQRAVVAALPAVPRPVVERFARRYVAGPTVDDALAVVAALGSRGRMATLDVLGEEHRSAERAQALVEEYLEILRRPSPVDPPPTLSVRMTGLGFRIDPELPLRHLLVLAGEAQRLGRKLTIDMEDVSTLEATLANYRRLRAEGHDNVGIVLQAYLRRTPADLDALEALAPRVRVVKGIWVEQPSVAYKDFDIIRAGYVRMLDRLLGCGSYVEIATHDEWLVAEALELLRKHGRAPDEYEFQMLLGVREELGETIVAGGHRLRVYVPFGRDWHAYCLRRLKENPDVARHVISDGLERVIRRRRAAAA
jgi:proline dehydrogenase